MSKPASTTSPLTASAGPVAQRLPPAARRSRTPLAGTLVLVIVPLLAALPGLLGLGLHHRTLLDGLAAFLAANHISTGLLVMPVQTARDAGLLLVAARALLAAAAGLAMAGLAGTLALHRTALAAGILYELAAAAAGLQGWSDLLLLAACPALLAALEHNIAAARSASLRLAASASVVIAFCSTRLAAGVLAVGVLWLIVRLCSPGPLRRVRAVVRVAAAALLAAVLTWPLLVLGLPFRLAGAGTALTLPSLGLPRWPAFFVSATPGLAARPIVSLAPVIFLAALAAGPALATKPVLAGADRRGRGLRLLLLAAAGAGLAGMPRAAPACLVSLVVLCAVSLDDIATGRSAARLLRAVLSALLLVCILAVASAGAVTTWPAALAALGLLATLATTGPKARRAGWLWPALAPIATAAMIIAVDAP